MPAPKVGDVITFKIDAKVVALLGCKDQVFPVCTHYDEDVLASDVPFIVALEGSKIDDDVSARYVKWLNEFRPAED